ncbi:MAG: flagellar biosynthesis protein FlhF [Chthonomonadales bacterium]
MKIKEFEGATLRECLNRIREDLGPEAVILETQKLKKGGMMGLGGRDAVRIIAATGIVLAGEERGHEANHPASAGAQRPAGDLPRRENAAPAARSQTFTLEAGLRSSGMRPQIGTQGDPAGEVAALRRELEGLRSRVDTLQRAALNPSAASEVQAASLSAQLCRQLCQAGVDPPLAAELVERLPDLNAWSPEAREAVAIPALREIMAEYVHAAGPIRVEAGGHKRVALVGPTGVGKTTTIAKLAAHYAVVEKRRVGFLTVDTYRVAAVEQLKTYANIMGLPLQVAYTLDEVPGMLQKLAACELVLIDTAGRSQKHSLHMEELRQLLELSRCEAHLVLSASTKLEDMEHQMKRFGADKIERLLFTKLDETVTYGTLFTVAARSGMDLSYLTTGQKVPEDIEVAHAGKVAALVLNGITLDRTPLHSRSGSSFEPAPASR